MKIDPHDENALQEFGLKIRVKVIKGIFFDWDILNPIILINSNRRLY